MKARFLSVVAGAVLTAASVASFQLHAQEISEEHLKAARGAISATKATESFDNILPQTSLQLKNSLNNERPDKTELIDSIVDEEAINLAARRGDLENEAAKLFAASFNKEELEAIQAFFATETGQKYLDATPLLARELAKAAGIWRNGIQRDLANNSTKRLSEALGSDQ